MSSEIFVFFSFKFGFDLKTIFLEIKQNCCCCDIFLLVTLLNGNFLFVISWGLQNAIKIIDFGKHERIS